MVDSAAIRAALIEELRPKALKSVDDISDDTDIYLELNINGTDLWEVFAWAAHTYGADFSSATPEHYDINEPPGRWFSSKPFRSVTIREMLDAIERGRWIAPN